MVALAAQNTAGDQNNFGVTFDAPCAAHRFSALACYAFRIEAIEIDTARHDSDFIPGRSIAVIDQLRDLLARCDHAIATRHDAVIQTLEDILFAKALVATCYEGNARKARGHERAPAARTAKGVNDIASPLAPQPQQNKSIAQHDDRIVARHIKRNEFATAPSHVGYETSGTRNDDCPMTCPGENANQLDRAGVGSTAIERGDD